jgi:4-hydroxybenzoyl-CoA reductase subunit beta
VNLPHFDYHAPDTLAECARLLAGYGTDADILAGGTDLFVRMKYGLTTPSLLVSLSNIDGMEGVSCDIDNGLIIGARAGLEDLARSPIIIEKYPAIADAASLVATRQIRHMATVGGNLLQHTRCFYYNRSATWGKAVPACIKRAGDVCHVVPGSARCFAVYRGDMAPVLIALGARVTFVSTDKAEEVPLESVFTGDGKKPFRNAEGSILARISIPRSSPTVLRYKKYRIRNGIDFPLAGAAVALFMNDDVIAGIRVCLTGVWSSPVLVNKAAEIACNRRLDAALVRELADAAYEAAHPLSNLEGSPERRRSMIRLMVRDMLQPLC